MALPYLVKHIYSYGTEEVIRRGKRIFALKNIELIKFDPMIGNIHCRVKDDGYSTYYKVTIERPKRLKAQFSDERIAELRFDKSLFL